VWKNREKVFHCVEKRAVRPVAVAGQRRTCVSIPLPARFSNESDPRHAGYSMLISVILSFRNESENLPELVRRLEHVFAAEAVDYELIFINDASTDSSLELLLKARERNKSVKIINMSRRFGVTPCVLAGFEKARGDAVVYMDTDLQDPPELIPQMLQKWREGADIVHTTRTARKGENAFKMWVTRQAYKVINGLSDITILQNTGDFKLVSRRALNEILKLGEFDPFLRGLVAWVGFKQVQVFYERDPRFAGETKCSLWRTLSPHREFLRGITTFSTIPLYFALFLGLATAVLSFVFFVAMVLVSLAASKGSGLFWPPIQLGTSLLLGGIILFTVGILGIYVARIHRAAMGRPRYIISEFIGEE
jgi:polyisoprenyl-phosphate glycosyltransferase